MHTDTTTKAVAYNVRRLMNGAGETLSSMERATGISRERLRRRLTGNFPWPTSEMATIADHFGVSVADLVTPQEVAA